MRRVAASVVVAALAFGVVAALHAAADMPAWAYAIPVPPPPGTPPPAPNRDTSMKSLPGSSRQFTLQEVGNGNGPADWYPEDHPPMPDIVAHGKRTEARACSLCHMPNGFGRPENSPVSGLPVSYFIEQMND